MASSNIKKELFKEFPPVSTESWEEVIKRDLKGADYNKKLIWRSVDGITVRPYFRREDLKDLHISDSYPGEYPYTRGSKSKVNNWFIRQELAFESLKQTGEKALFMLSKGVESISFKFKKQISPDELSELLLKLPLKDVEVNIQGLDISILSELLSNLQAGNELKDSDIRINWDWDPLGDFSITGKLGDEEAFYKQMAEVIQMTKNYPKIRVVEVNGLYFRNAGSKFVQELAFSLAQANEYLAEMDELGVPADETATKMTFNFAIGSNYFLELAKLRAARMLWSRIVESYDITKPEKAKMYVHAETSMWNKTVYDPYVNMLRTTTEAMSAVLGGVNSLTVHPFDASFKEAGEFSERLARNKQIILKEEAHFDKVVDPAGGSYYIEKLTDSIGEEAWKLFQEVEKRGGYSQAFMEGYIQNEITSSAQQRDENIARRKEVLLGINQFPNSNETLDPQADSSHIMSPVPDPSKADAHPLIFYRGAEGFELLRMATEKAAKRPIVFLLTIGSLPWRKARAEFASNFFGCAGYEIVNNLGFETIDEGMKAAKEAKADIIVLCSSDDEYSDYGPEAAKANNDKSILAVAGFPKSSIEKLESAGVSRFIHVKTNVLETLNGFNKDLGIKL